MSVLVIFPVLLVLICVALLVCVVIWPLDPRPYRAEHPFAAHQRLLAEREAELERMRPEGFETNEAR